jgi:hypothetical protein
MKVDRVIRNERQTIEDILRALDHNLHARNNFAPEGTLGQALMSNGPDAPPSYQDLPITETLTEEQVLALFEDHTHDGADIVSGQVLPEFLGTGTRDGTRFLRDDGVWSILSPVAWADITGVPTDFAGFGLDDDLAAALAGFSRIGHRHYYDEIIGTPAPGGGGVTLEEVREELIGYSKIGHTHYYDGLMGLPVASPGGGLTAEDVRLMLAPYSVIGHNHRIEEEAVAHEFILANQIFGG